MKKIRAKLIEAGTDEEGFTRVIYETTPEDLMGFELKFYEWVELEIKPLPEPHECQD